MILQITNQTILGVCVFGWRVGCLGRQPSQCGRISGPPALLSRSFLPGEGGDLENTCIPPSLGSSLWKLFAHRQHRFPSALSTLEEVLWVRLCLVGRSPWLSNGTGEQRPNSGRGISTTSWPRSKAICFTELQPGRNQLILCTFLPQFQHWTGDGRNVYWPTKAPMEIVYLLCL